MKAPLISNLVVQNLVKFSYAVQLSLLVDEGHKAEVHSVSILTST
jgi:hypothetical protein